MKRQQLLTFIISLAIFFGCEDSINQQQEPLTYNGIEVLETTPSFVLKVNRALANDSSPNSAIETDLPYGTVYGHESDPDNVYLAQGGELLPDGSWTDQIFKDMYEARLYSNSAVYFENPATVTVTNAINCKYLDVNDVWVPITADATITAKAISAGPGGSSYFASDSFVILGHGGDNGSSYDGNKKLGHGGNKELGHGGDNGSSYGGSKELGHGGDNGSSYGGNKELGHGGDNGLGISGNTELGHGGDNG